MQKMCALDVRGNGGICQSIEAYCNPLNADVQKCKKLNVPNELQCFSEHFQLL